MVHHLANFPLWNSRARPAPGKAFPGGRTPECLAQGPDLPRERAQSSAAGDSKGIAVSALQGISDSGVAMATTFTEAARRTSHILLQKVLQFSLT